LRSNAKFTKSLAGRHSPALSNVVVVLAIGLLPVLIFAWAFELTLEGLKRFPRLHTGLRERPASETHEILASVVCAKDDTDRSVNASKVASRNPRPVVDACMDRSNARVQPPRAGDPSHR
jgi:hypothetical protein